jgi:hypothetical protein
MAQDKNIHELASHLQHLEAEEKEALALQHALNEKERKLVLQFEQRKAAIEKQLQKRVSEKRKQIDTIREQNTAKRTSIKMCKKQFEQQLRALQMGNTSNLLLFCIIP